MPTFRWWIDEPLIRGNAHPTDGDLQALRAQGFSIAVSLLEESKQPPKYQKVSAINAGWTIYSIPIPENHAPSLEQIRDFMARLAGLPERTKVLVFCESGKGRTACMAAAYLIAKCHTANLAIARVSVACSDNRWATAERRRVLRAHERSMKIGKF
jgi:protein-tyrosine phosphatase